MMNKSVVSNYSNLKLTLLVLPVVLLLIIVLFLYSQDSLSTIDYIEVQKEYFYSINHYLGQFPSLMYNLTQLGDASVFMAFVIIFVVYAPKMWEAILSASLFSALFSKILKSVFSVPRPAEVLDHDSFIIVGRTLPGFSSLPSGHSITVFMIIAVLLFAFMPKKLSSKIFWVASLIILGLFVVFTRVGVGAHYPLDVITGGIIGYLAGLLGIFFSRKYRLWNWINNKKFYPIFIISIVACCISLLIKIVNENYIIFYLAFISLLFSLYKITQIYVKK